MTCNTYKIQVQFTDGTQREFELEAISIDAAIADIEDAYQMKCTLTGIFKGFGK